MTIRKERVYLGEKGWGTGRTLVIHLLELNTKSVSLMKQREPPGDTFQEDMALHLFFDQHRINCLMWNFHFYNLTGEILQQHPAVISQSGQEVSKLKISDSAPPANSLIILSNLQHRKIRNSKTWSLLGNFTCKVGILLDKTHLCRHQCLVPTLVLFCFWSPALCLFSYNAGVHLTLSHTLCGPHT